MSVVALPLRHRPDFGRQGFGGEGLRDDFHPGKKEARGKSGVLRIAGNKEHLQAWAERTGLFRELTAVQAWQADIGDEQVDPDV